MLCLPGLTPVWNVDQATGEIGGTVEPSGLKQPWSRSAGEVGKLALVEHLLGQAVVHAVEAEDDHPLDPAAPQRPPAEEGPRQQPHRPGEEREERREDRGEDREERAGQREPGPGPDVGQGRASGPGR